MGIFIKWLADAARMTGYPVVEVDGWETRGASDGQGMAVVEGVVGHHTAGPSTGEYPSYNVVLNGRPGISGPLAHLGIGRSGTIYVFGAGKANHAGYSEHAGFSFLNNKYIGIEAEDDGDGTWTDEQLDVYPRLVAALLHYMNRDESRYASHRTVAIPSGRKIDPAGITDQAMQAQVKAYLADLPSIKKGNVAIPEVVSGAPVKVIEPKPVSKYESYKDVKAGSRLIKLYSRGSDVKVLQHKLGLAEDGYFGPNTEKAVRAFQQKNGLAVDGLVGKNTWGKLLAHKSTSNVSVAGLQRAVRVSADGKWGPNTDKALKAVLFNTGPTKYRQVRVGTKVDGYWGPNSEAARKLTIRKIQDALGGLEDDGVVGPKTKARFEEVRREFYLKY